MGFDRAGFYRRLTLRRLSRARSLPGTDPKLPGHENRKHDRFHVHWPATCLAGGEDIGRVNVVDVSSGGMGLDCDLPVETGQELTIELPHIGIFRCVMAWKDGTRCGLRFIKEVELDDGSLDQVASWLTCLPH